MFNLGDHLSQKALKAFCSKYHIKKLPLFGSALHGGDTPDSDIDLLVEFEPNHVLGLLTMAEIEIELTQAIGRKVDLRTPAELSTYFRDDVLAQAKVEYAS